MQILHILFLFSVEKRMTNQSDQNLRADIWPTFLECLAKLNLGYQQRPYMTKTDRQKPRRRQQLRRKNSNITEFRQKHHIPVFQYFIFIHQNKLLTQYCIMCIEKVEILFRLIRIKKSIYYEKLRH